jgi:hypothetical protein
MKTIIGSIAATWILALAIAPALASSVEIVEVKNVGLAAADQSKSIIQVKWSAAPQTGTSIKSFDVAIEVAYADGSSERAKTTVAGTARSARFELPTLHFSTGRPGAEMKTFKVNIAVSLTETASKQGSF